MTLGEKLHKLRKAQGLSQEQLATQITVSRQAISKWELNESIPDTENIMQLSKLFKVSTDYLLSDVYDNDIPAVKNTLDNKLINRYDAAAKWYGFATVFFSVLLLLILIKTVIGSIENYGKVVTITFLMKGVPLLLITLLSGILAICYKKKAQKEQGKCI